MASRKYLTRTDIAIGRLAMRHRLLSREQLEECTSALENEAASGASTSLAEVLVRMGYITAEEAGQLKERAGEKTRVRRGTSRIERPPSGVFRKVDPGPAVSPGSDSEEEAAEAEDISAAAARDARLRKITSKIAHDRVCPELLEYIIRNKLTILNAQNLAAALGESREKVVNIMRRWIKAGILRSVGDYPYCYSPIEQRKQEIEEFLEAWRDKNTRTRVMSYILSSK